MKRHVQFEGVRKWAGDHLLELQSEPLKLLDGFFGSYGPYVLMGCGITKTGDVYDVSPGLVVLEGKDRTDTDAVMVVPFAGAAGVTLPLYLTLAWQVRQREYMTGGVKPIAYDYYAAASTVPPADGVPHLPLNDRTARFVDVIQDTTHSFITEAERTKWNGLRPVLEAYVDELFEKLDATRIGEIRHFAADMPFENDDYLLCDGSIIGWDDYPGLGIPVNTLVDTFTMHDSYEHIMGNGEIWVRAAGGYGASPSISTSPNLLDWTTRVSDSGIGDIVRLQYIEGVWIACFSAALCFSRDGGISWTVNSYEAFGGISHVAKVGDIWLCRIGHNVDNLGFVQSTDLVNWTPVTGGRFSENILGATIGGGRAIKISGNANNRLAVYSDNLVDWHPLELPLVSNERPSVVAWSLGRWIIGTSSEYLLMSDDGGNTWERREIVFDTPKEANFSMGSIGRIAANGHVWAIGWTKGISPSFTEHIAVSQDRGETWNELAPMPSYRLSTFGIYPGGDDTLVAGPDYSEWSNNHNFYKIRVARVLPSGGDGSNTRTYMRVSK